MPETTPEFSFGAQTLTGADTFAGVKPVPSLTPMTTSPEPVNAQDAGPATDGGIDVAYRWSQLYARDVEYEPFFDWIGKRSNPERTDFRQILDSIPITWGPEQLPPPLRRFFLGKFSS